MDVSSPDINAMLSSDNQGMYGQDGLPGSRVEPFQIGGIDDGQFMIAHNRRDVARYNPLHHRLGFGAVADHVSEADDRINVGFIDIIEDLPQGFHVAMDIGNNGYPHNFCVLKWIYLSEN